MVGAPHPVPATLPLQPGVASYAATVTWEAYARGDYQCTTITKQVLRHVEQGPADTYKVRFETNATRITALRDLHPLEQLAERLGTLYQRIAVQAAPTGELMALLNHEELKRTWASISEEVQASTTEADEVTHTLLAFVGRQVDSPTGLLESLQHDYLYQALLPNLYQQPLTGLAVPARTRRFSNFFDKTPLFFTERVAVQPGAVPEHFNLFLHGTLDAAKTDTAAIQSLIAKALHTAQVPAGTPPLPTTLPAPHFAYEATYVVEQPTGLFVRAEMTVYARAGTLFNKQYTLTLTRQ